MAQDIYFEDMSSLVAATQSIVPYILTEYVAPTAEDILKKHIKSDIYGAGSNAGRPKEGAWVNGSTYQRRGDALENGVFSRLDKPDTLLVSSNANANKSIIPGYAFFPKEEGSFLKLIERGGWGIWRSGFPRPAVSNTEREYKTSLDIQNQIKRGINDLIGTCT